MDELHQKIDKLIEDQYKTQKKFGELAQLAQLFEFEFLNKLYNLLSDEFTGHYKKKAIELSLSWIDKRPLASFCDDTFDYNGNKITQKVEVGDVAFMFHHQLEASGTIVQEESYSILMQAKRSNSNKEQKVPVTPSKTKNNSSEKEFTLLSKWPTFDLYKTSANKKSCQTKLKLTELEDNDSKYAWYMVCPPRKLCQWDTRWMCAPPLRDSIFDVTLGQIFESLYQRKKIKGYSSAIGKRFNYIRTWKHGQDSSGISAWDTLNNEILVQCKESSLPKHLFGHNAGQRVRSVDEYFELLDELLLKGKIKLNGFDREEQQSSKTILGDILGVNNPDVDIESLLNVNAMPVLSVAIMSVD
ncbi:hypothetical protein [Psychromonas sp. Urea-02u-13]|jgi:hypothetical protein|uniref:hypothetical protein n=1 Tax=Psychromonas sp. Urea-02u-13 TaxID=2058326 RepID=UPI000C322F33|nr:hypothetical protein [Psychromonas sp. Urea-02u-13]PKG37924.1 hypothetical protein CXF74_16430 [Psychromonas sp. Urea-02u-13]